jgi:hypothetical protein
MGLTHRWQVDNLNRPSEPVIRSWSVASVRSWSVAQIRDDDGLVAFDVLAGHRRFRGSIRDYITGRLNVPSCFGLIDGRPLSEAAHNLLRDRLVEAIRPFWQRAEADREAKVAALVAQGGEVVERYLSWVKVRIGEQIHCVRGNEE